MSDKGFKRIVSAPTEQATSAVPSPELKHPAQDPRRNPEAALAAAAAIAPTLPPTRIEAPPPKDPLGQLNLKIRTSLIDQLADAASREGTTQKVLVCRALAAAGYRVHPDDLSDRSNHRRSRAILVPK
jgi:hypothetical protein